MINKCRIEQILIIIRCLQSPSDVDARGIKVDFINVFSTICSFKFLALIVLCFSYHHYYCMLVRANANTVHGACSICLKGLKTYSIYGVASIMREVMTNGPVEVTFEAYADFASYKSGVYQHVAGGLLSGHAVRLLGWGKENGVPYWLLANTWGPNWGEKGFFKFLRGRNECGIESVANAGIPKL